MFKITAEEKKQQEDVRKTIASLKSEMLKKRTELSSFRELIREATRRGEKEREVVLREQLEGVNSEIFVLEEAIEEQARSPALMSVVLKETANEMSSGAFGGINPLLFIGFAEDFYTDIIKGDEGQRAIALIKTLVLDFFEAAAAEDLMAARAKVTATRYRTLVEAGLPPDVAAKVVVAEASKPAFNWPQSTSKK